LSPAEANVRLEFCVTTEAKIGASMTDVEFAVCSGAKQVGLQNGNVVI
jgi:hypothetical protein